jgi:hypothetical protein
VKKRFSVEQITTVLQQAAQGVPVGDLCRKVGISGRVSTAGPALALEPCRRTNIHQAAAQCDLSRGVACPKRQVTSYAQAPRA